MSIISQIQGCVVEYFDQCSVNIIFRDQNRAIWSYALEQSAYIPTQYCHAALDFFQCCQQDKMTWVADVSIILRNEQHDVYGVWPLTVAFQNNQYILSSYGQPVYPPLFVQTLSTRKKKKLAKQCFKLCEALAQQYTVSSWRSIESYRPNKQSLSDWYQAALSAGMKTHVQHELFVDLGLSIVEIKRYFRKSYGALIKQGLRVWKVAVLEGENQSVWHQFHALYDRVAGKKVRSEKAWDIQYQAIVNGQAVLIYLTDEQGNMVGGGYFFTSRDECVYAVAAYDRALFDKPLGHAVQFRIIEIMKGKGLQWYKIGPIVYPQDAPSEKELSIAHFKQGFATHCVPSFLLEQSIHQEL